ncbi:MAG: hypothetical protein JRG95_11365 [Deltaproteobacteria bacterium]|nr:hypothetical protein [Deltaproteobacteria bacterium]
MRMILLQLGLALSLLARGPLCDVLCEPAAVEVEAAVASQHGMTNEAPCHGEPMDPVRGTGQTPAIPHDSCAGCEDLLVASADSATAATWIDLRASRASVHESPSQVAVHPMALSSPLSGRPEPPDILLLKSTLLI